MTMIPTSAEWALKYSDREMLIKAAEQRIAKIENNRERIAVEYGYEIYEIADATVLEVLEAEKGIEECRNCKGLPCKKKYGFKNCTPLIKSNYPNDISVSNEYCKYTIAKYKVSRNRRTIKSSQIPRIYAGKTFADYVIDDYNKIAVAVSKKFSTSLNKGLYIHGESGVGKTYLASITAQQILANFDNEYSIIFADVPSLMNELRSSFNQAETNDEIDAKMKLIQSADILFLDDIGTERISEWTLERLYMMINSRYNNGGKLFVTSNYSLNDLYIKYGKNKIAERITSRINQSCNIISIKGEDRRKN